MTTPAPLRAAVIGVRGMGRNQATLLSKMPEYQLVAVCDLDVGIASACATELGVKSYQSFAQLLAVEKPDIVAICTPNTSHALLTIEAARGGVKGVYCEKPMATNLGDASAMVKACDDAEIPLVINHQRRVGADLVEARRLIDAGAIGDLMEARGYCGGDILSDGTHLIDSLLFLAGDSGVEWVSGQVSRDLSSPIWHPKNGPPNPRPGFRYGHAVESGGMGLAQLKNGVRLSIHCGDHQRQHAYQDYEITGTRGRLWRNGDSLSPNLFIQDVSGGDLDMIFDSKAWHHLAVPSKTGRGLWRALDTDAKKKSAMKTSYELFAQTIHTGAPHPMNARVALRGLELVMAIYESARLNRRLDMPLQQDRFPLDMMIAEGRA